MADVEFCEPIVTYEDPGGIWPVVEKGLAPCMPLSQVTVTNPRTGDGETVEPVPFAFHEASQLPPSAYAETACWHRAPYLRLYVLQCEEFDVYKGTHRSKLKEWVDKQPDAHYIILYVPMGNSDTHARSHKKIYDKLKSDFKDRTCRLEVNAGAIKAQPGWDDLLERMRAHAAATFVERCEQFKTAARNLSATRFQPQQWDFWPFFIAQEGLAFVCAQFSLENEALKIYNELMNVYTQVFLPAERLPHTPPLPPFGGKTANDDRGRILDPAKKACRRAILDKTVTEFDFREYVFGRQAQMWMIQVSLSELARHALDFVTSMCTRIQERGQESGLPPYFAPVWAYSALVHVGGECEARRDRLKTDPDSDKDAVAQLTVELGIVLGELYLAARARFEQLGVHLGLIEPHRFSYAGAGGIETIEAEAASKPGHRMRSSTVHQSLAGKLARASSSSSNLPGENGTGVAGGSRKDRRSLTPDGGYGRIGRASSIGSPADIHVQRPGRLSTGNSPEKGTGRGSTAGAPPEAGAGRERTESLGQGRPRLHSWVDPLFTPTKPDDGKESPVDTGDASESLVMSSKSLKKLLRNAITFETHFIDLTNAASRNFHHSFRARNVIRLNGEIAAIHFYRRRFEEAEPLFKSLCTMFQEDGWYELVYAVRMQLAECQRQLKHFAEYVASCLQMLEVSSAVNEQERLFYFHELQRVALGSLPHVMRGELAQLVTISFDKARLTPLRHVVLGETINLECDLISHLPEPLTIPKLSVRIVGNKHRAQKKHAIIFTLENLEIQPGKNEIRFAEKAFQLGRFHFDKLWGELGQLVLAQDLKGDRLGIRDARIIVEESVSSLEVMIKQPECLIVGHTQLIRVALNSHSDNIESGTLELRSSTGLLLEDCPETMMATVTPASGGESVKVPFKFQGGKSTLTDIQSDSIFEFHIPVKATDDQAVDHKVTCHIDYIKNTKEAFVYKNKVDISFVTPLQMDTIWTHCLNDRFMLQVLLECTATVPLTIVNSALGTCEQLDVLSSFNDSKEVPTLEPGQVYSFLFDMQAKPPLPVSVRCPFDVELKLNLGTTQSSENTAVSASAGPFMNQYQVHLDPRRHQALYEVSTQICDNTIEGVFTNMTVHITRLAPQPITLQSNNEKLFLCIDPDASQWFVSGATKTVVDPHATEVTMSYQVVPVSIGHLKVPHVRLVRHILGSALPPTTLPTRRVDGGTRVLVKPSGAMTAFAGPIAVDSIAQQ